MNDATISTSWLKKTSHCVSQELKRGKHNEEDFLVQEVGSLNMELASSIEF